MQILRELKPLLSSRPTQYNSYHNPLCTPEYTTHTKKWRKNYMSQFSHWQILSALFPRFGLPSTLIHHENEAFRKRSSNWQDSVKIPALRFSVEGHFNNGAFRACPSFPQTQIPRWPVTVAFSNSSGVAWMENTWCVFRVTSFSDFSGAELTGP